jgi:hypothetical protein
MRFTIQNRPAPAGDPDFGAKLQVAGGDLLAQAGAATRNEDALTLEDPFLEHGRSGLVERLF